MAHHPQDFDAASSHDAGTARDETFSRDDFHSVLSQAIAGLDRNSYAARGAVYEREYKLLMRELYSASPPLTDAEIDAELRVFRNAVRATEFGQDEEYVALAQENHGPFDPNDGHPSDRPVAFPRDYGNRQQEHDDFHPAPEVVSPAAPPPRVGRDWSSGRSRELQRRTLRDPPAWSQRPPVQGVPSAQIESALEAALNLEPAQAMPDVNPGVADGDGPVFHLKRRTSIARKILYRVLVAVALLAVGTAGYVARELSLPSLNKTANGSSAPPLQAILFDGARPDLNGAKFAGKVSWRLRTENSGAESLPVVELDLDLPGRRIAATIAMRREPVGSSMSHLFEIRFIGADRQIDPDITSIAGIVMTSADMTRPDSLTGHVVTVKPGVFIFGLSGLPNDREQNMRRLTEFPWIGIPISYSNGAGGVIAFEKGEEGDKVINEALRLWASRS